MFRKAKIMEITSIQEIEGSRGAVPVAQSFLWDMKGKPEILAPAGSVEGMRAAVAAGCDAVYMGGSRFGARAYAGNPEEDEMLEALAYCHLHGVKLYMTVNTLLKNREIEEVLFSFLRPYYEAGLDAVIVQDMGVLRFISKHFPELPVHASTQMSLTMGQGAEELKKYHVTRMVPARELGMEELFQMRRDTELELEVFVHGALCYCYSGQCLFSSMLGGRSGNRGRCAQPCRMPYQSLDGKKRAPFLLSPKELCNLAFLPELIEAGIDSFKIEGRMKRPEYTAFVTSVYRKYVDLYCSLGAAGYRDYLTEHDREWQEDLRCLAELYNRDGFTDGYLAGEAGNISERSFGRRGKMLAGLRPKHGGVCVGKVLSVGKHEVVYQTTHKLSAQDVVEFRDARQQPSYEYTLGEGVAAGRKVTARYQKGSLIQKGDKVYRTKDARLLASIREKYLEKESRLPVSAFFTAIPGKPVQLNLTHKGRLTGSRFTVECSGEVCQRAAKQPASEEAVRKVLNQTGGSPFYLETSEIRIEGEVFLPVKILKALRRQALDRLKAEIEGSFRRKVSEAYIPEAFEGNCVSAVRAPSVSAEVLFPEQLESVLGRKEITVIYLHTEAISAEMIKECFYKIVKAGKSPWLVLPYIFRRDIWIAFEKGMEDREGIFTLNWEGYLVKNLESIAFLRKAGRVLEDNIRLDCNMYVMNREACRFWEEQGIHQFTLPFELTGKELGELDFLPKTEMVVYGKIPLMVSAQCIRANTGGCVGNDMNLANRGFLFANQKGQRFEAVNFCKYCYNVIYQNIPVSVRELVCRNRKLCAAGMRYSFTTESREETAAVLQGNFRGETQYGHFRMGIE